MSENIKSEKVRVAELRAAADKMEAADDEAKLKNQEYQDIKPKWYKQILTRLRKESSPKISLESVADSLQALKIQYDNNDEHQNVKNEALTQIKELGNEVFLNQYKEIILKFIKDDSITDTQYQFIEGAHIGIRYIPEIENLSDEMDVINADLIRETYGEEIQNIIDDYNLRGSTEEIFSSITASIIGRLKVSLNKFTSKEKIYSYLDMLTDQDIIPDKDKDRYLKFVSNKKRDANQERLDGEDTFKIKLHQLVDETKAEILDTEISNEEAYQKLIDRLQSDEFIDNCEHIFMTESGSWYFVINGHTFRFKKVEDRFIPQGFTRDLYFITDEEAQQVHDLNRSQRDLKGFSFPKRDIGPGLRPFELGKENSNKFGVSYDDFTVEEENGHITIKGATESGFPYGEEYEDEDDIEDFKTKKNETPAFHFGHEITNLVK